MVSHPGRSYTLRTSIARPTPYALSTAIVRTLCLATVISRPSARNRILFALCRTGRRSALPRRLLVCAQRVFSFYDFFNYPPFAFPYLPLNWSRGVGLAVSSRVAPPIFHPGVNLVINHGLLFFLRFPLWYATSVSVTWPLVRIVWRVDSTGRAPPTPSDALLPGESTLAKFRQR